MWLAPYGCIRGALTLTRQRCYLTSFLPHFLPPPLQTHLSFFSAVLSTSLPSVQNLPSFSSVLRSPPWRPPLFGAPLDAPSSYTFPFWDLCHCPTSRWGRSNSPSHCWPTRNKIQKWPSSAEDPAWTELNCFMAAYMALLFAFGTGKVSIT